MGRSLCSLNRKSARTPLFRFPISDSLFPLLKLQTRFARGIRQRLDAAVITEAGAVERDRLYAGGTRLLGDGLAHRRGGVLVLGALQARAQSLLHGGGRSQHLA